METSDTSEQSVDDGNGKKTSVLLWRGDQECDSLDLLTSCCQQQNLEVKEHDRLPDANCPRSLIAVSEPRQSFKVCV